MKSVFSCLIFWFYFITKKGPERDAKIEKLSGYIMSNFLLFMGIMGLTHPSGLLVTDGDKEFFVFFALCVIFQTIFQCTERVNAFKRLNDIKSIRGTLKEGFDFLFSMSGFALQGLFDEFKDIINEFYKDYQGKDTQYQYYQSNFSNETYQDKTIEIKRIYEKYDIPLDANEDTIKKRFRSLAKKYHPDMQDGDEKRFIELREEIKFLMDYIKMKKGA